MRKYWFGLLLSSVVLVLPVSAQTTDDPGVFEQAVRDAWVWCVDYVILQAGFAASVFFGVLDFVIPEATMNDLIASLSPLVYWLEVANGWLPVSETMWLVNIYVVFACAFIIVKYIIKAVPTVG